MSYEHYGRIGDIWKHFPLTTFIKNENPIFYVESNSAFPIYDLKPSVERNYGVYQVIESADNNELINNSVYLDLLKKSSTDNTYNKYLGSPGFALNLLGNDSNYIFCDIDIEPLHSVKDHASTLGINDKVEIICGDSIETLWDRLDTLPKNSFIHIDPYMIIDKNEQGHTYFDLFLKSVKLGLKTMLWYGYNNNFQKKYLYNWMNKKVSIDKIKNDMCFIELHLASIQEEDIVVNPGIVGSGIAIANLSEQSMNDFELLSNLLIDIYENSVFDNIYSGKLVKNKFNL